MTYFEIEGNGDSSINLETLLIVRERRVFFSPSFSQGIRGFPEIITGRKGARRSMISAKSYDTIRGTC